MLKLPLKVTGVVTHGEKVGRTIGFPTANLTVAKDLSNLEPGVYFGTCTIGERELPCLPYFGPRLVFGETKNVFEVFIYDFLEEIYDQELNVVLKEYLRPPKKVSSLEELKLLLENDLINGRKLFSLRHPELDSGSPSEF